MRYISYILGIDYAAAFVSLHTHYRAGRLANNGAAARRAISLSARRGIIIKNPVVLEQITTCRTLIFDKTGTLTYGKPSLTEILCAPGFTQAEVLRLAASLERYSKHPLSSAILSAAQEANLSLEEAARISEKPGAGLAGIVAGRDVHITGRGKVPVVDLKLPPAAPGMECLVFLDGAFAAAFRFHDAPRKESKSFVNHLRPRHEVNKVMLVSRTGKQRSATWPTWLASQKCTLGRARRRS